MTCGRFSRSARDFRPFEVAGPYSRWFGESPDELIRAGLATSRQNSRIVRV